MAQALALLNRAEMFTAAFSRLSILEDAVFEIDCNTDTNVFTLRTNDETLFFAVRYLGTMFGDDLDSGGQVFFMNTYEFVFYIGERVINVQYVH